VIGLITLILLVIALIFRQRIGSLSLRRWKCKPSDVECQGKRRDIRPSGNPTPFLGTFNSVGQTNSQKIHPAQAPSISVALPGDGTHDIQEDALGEKLRNIEEDVNAGASPSVELTSTATVRSHPENPAPEDQILLSLWTPENYYGDDSLRWVYQRMTSLLLSML
jgi:hypothetical protein